MRVVRGSPPSVLPDISPSRGEIGWARRPASSRTGIWSRASAASLQSPPLRGRCHKVTEGGEFTTEELADG